MGWKKYLDDYEEQEDGKYVYIGKYYRINCDEQRLRRFKLTYGFLAGAAALLFILAGLSMYLSSRFWFVSVPFAAVIIPLFFVVMDTVRICRGPERMTRKEYQESVVQHKTACVGMAALTLITVIGDLVFLLVFCPNFLLLQELLFFVFSLGQLVLAILRLLVTRRMPSGPEGGRA